MLTSLPWLQPGCWGWDRAVVNDFSGNNTAWGCHCLRHNCETQQEFRHPKVMRVAAPPRLHADINPRRPALAIRHPQEAP